jgi:Mrp family chromosome partitioning ATPase
MQKASPSTAGPHVCDTIRSADTIDPFEGLDLNEICVSPEQLAQPSKSQPPADSHTILFGLNPLDGIDISELTISIENPDSGTVTKNISKKQSTPQPPENVSDHSKDLSANISRPPLKQTATYIDPLIKRAYHYAELTQIREKIFASLKESQGNTLLIASPHDNTGSSLLAAALGYNATCSCQQSVLLIDCNMRRSGLHKFFKLPQSYGFTDLIQENLPWQAVVKETGVNGLSMITAGDHCKGFSNHLHYSHIPQLIQATRPHYDLIIFDTSPVLARNRNNVNITSLTSEVDYFLLITKLSGTTRDDLTEVRDIIEAGNETIDGIVLNEHTPDKKPQPFQS